MFVFYLEFACNRLQVKRWLEMLRMLEQCWASIAPERCVSSCELPKIIFVSSPVVQLCFLRSIFNLIRWASTSSTHWKWKIFKWKLSIKCECHPATLDAEACAGWWQNASVSAITNRRLVQPTSAFRSPWYRSHRSRSTKQSDFTLINVNYNSKCKLSHWCHFEQIRV